MRRKLKIWHLKNDVYKGKLDEVIEAVVFAADEVGARHLMALCAQDEPREIWIDPAKSTITQIGVTLAGAAPAVFMTESKGF